MSYQQSEVDMQTTHIKEFLANTKLTKTEVAEALKSLAAFKRHNQKRD